MIGRDAANGRQSWIGDPRLHDASVSLDRIGGIERTVGVSCALYDLEMSGTET
jgi:hypothetical protein